MDGVGDLIDLDRYPLGERGSKRYDAFIETCRAMHDEQGACNLQGFIRPEAIEKLRHEADTLLPVGYDKVFTRNVYFTDDDPSLPADHPVRQFWTFSSNQVADDQIDDETLIRQIYLWQPLVDFIADVESCATLYPMADEFQALNIIALEEGGGSPWHYDTNAFTVTLLLEAPEGGGDFVYAPDIRTKDNPNYDGVKRVLDGDKSLIRQLPRDAGTLTLFHGRHSLHGVEAVEGDTPRVTAIMTYDEQPDCRAGRERNTAIYGPRVEAIFKARDMAQGR